MAPWHNKSTCTWSLFAVASSSTVYVHQEMCNVGTRKCWVKRSELPPPTPEGNKLIEQANQHCPVLPERKGPQHCVEQELEEQVPRATSSEPVHPTPAPHGSCLVASTDRPSKPHVAPLKQLIKASWAWQHNIAEYAYTAMCEHKIMNNTISRLGWP